MDAQAVLSAMQKGRSGAPTLRHPVRQAGAISLACGWRWRFGYLPSGSNPADDPSRGVVRCRTVRKLNRASVCTRLDKLRVHCRRVLRSHRRDYCPDCLSESGVTWPSTAGSDSLAVCLP